VSPGKGVPDVGTAGILVSDVERAARPYDVTNQGDWPAKTNALGDDETNVQLVAEAPRELVTPGRFSLCAQR
jgi:hypothetical protein